MRRDNTSLNPSVRWIPPSLQADLQRLIAGDEVQLPKFNFPLGRSEPGETVKLDKDQLVILEGIHGLNPLLLPGLSRRETTRIYVSCLTQLNLDRHNRISTTDTRLLRRILRDARDRGYTAQQTINHWDAVGRGGEEAHLPLPGECGRDVQLRPGL